MLFSWEVQSQETVRGRYPEYLPKMTKDGKDVQLVLEVQVTQVVLDYPITECLQTR